eukprot:COSAG03_NODE_16276_length_406_cov_2.537459_1_plen_28_part_01
MAREKLSPACWHARNLSRERTGERQRDR